MNVKIEDYKKLFISEAEDILQALEQGLLEMEGSSDTEHSLNELFRAAHNLKGISGAMGYETLVKAGHSLENVLDGLRKSGGSLSNDEMSKLLEAVDCLRILVDAAIDGNKENSLSESNALERLISITTMLSVAPSSEPSENKTGKTGTIAGDASTEKKYEEESKRVEEVLIASEIRGLNKQISTTKVELSRLDKLMDLIGELIISRIRMTSIVEELGSKPLKDEIALSSRLISEMQKEVMEARLIPVGQIFQRFRRLVRDLSAKRSKNVQLELVGEDIGLDRVLLENMVDPIVHLIRNAIDHGIESVEERAVRGKPAEGKIVLSAMRERNSVVISVSDDGRGMDVEEIYARYSRSGRSFSSPSELTEEVLWDIISSPGFSTSRVADEISGRGMGMNIVKKAVEAFGGTVSLSTEKYRGTTVSMRLPVNLSIVKALLFPVGDEIHAIPIEFIEETSRLELEETSSIGGQRVIATETGPIPLLTPRDIFGIASEFKSERFVKVIIIETGTKRVALAVDDIIGQQDVVIKALPAVLARKRGLSGATILGDGRVAFIWDPNTMLEGGNSNESFKKAVLLEN